MSLFQLGSVLFSLVMLYIISIHKKQAALSKLELAIWGALWSAFILIVLFPQTLQGITETLKFARLFDLLVVGAFMVITILVFVSYLNIRETGRKLEQLIRDLALKEVTKK